MRHVFGFSRNARRHFQNAREGVPDAPFSRNCARSGSTARRVRAGVLWHHASAALLLEVPVLAVICRRRQVPGFAAFVRLGARRLALAKQSRNSLV